MHRRIRSWMTGAQILVSVAQTFLSVRQRQEYLCHWFSLFVILSLISSVTRAADVSSTDLAQRAKDVENMSLIDRDRLIRNWDAFQKMPADRQQHFRRLHQELQNDAKEGSALNHTMQTYSQWLQTLTPGQREDLRQAKTPNDKLDLVRKFKEDQDKRPDPPSPDGRERRPPGPGWGRGYFGPKPLSPVELDAALQGLVDNLPSGERSQFARTDDKEKWTRYRGIIQATVRQAGGPKEWPNKEQQSVVLAATKATEQSQQIDAIKDDRTRRSRLVMLLINSFKSQMRADAAASEPQPGDLERMYEDLDHATREKLIEMKPHEMRDELRRRFVQRQHESNPELQERSRRHVEFHDFTWKLMMDAELGGGRFGRPGERGPGERGDRGDHGRPRPPRD